MAKEGEGYLEHVRDWWERFNDDNVMVLVFEKMKEVCDVIIPFES